MSATHDALARVTINADLTAREFDALARAVDYYDSHLHGQGEGVRLRVLRAAWDKLREGRT